jgi:DNA-binding transcriptional ArsR family regulator
MNIDMRLTANLDDTLIALADPTRRAILHRLSQGDARVTELAEPFSISLNSVSKHIRLLERADLVRREKNGRDHWLSLNPVPVDEALQWMQAQRDAWTARLDTLEALLRAEDEAEAAQKKASKKDSKGGKTHQVKAKGKRT